jgi:hypothetical protein
MKRKLAASRWLLLFVLFVFQRSYSIAQSANTPKTSGKEISISITGIEYDDPAFTSLRDNLKGSTNAKNFKQSYNGGTAKISLSYSKSATDLWDELSATVKQPFKLTSIDGSRIALQLKSATSQSNLAKTSNATAATDTKTTSTSAKNNDDCTGCYIDLCKYDGTISMVGVVYKVIRYDEGTRYFRCENGILLEKSARIKTNYDNTTLEIPTDTVLKANAAVGDSWGYVFTNKYGTQWTLRKTIVGKDMVVEANGKTYKNVLAVNYKIVTENKVLKDLVDVFGKKIAPADVKNYYYAKGAGLIKTEILDPDYDLQKAVLQSGVKTASGTSSNQAFQVEGKTLKGKIDPSIAGVWKYHSETLNITGYYVFKENGIFEYYAGNISPTNSLSQQNCQWRVDGAFIETLCNGSKEVMRMAFRKVNDPASGKPALVIEWKGGEPPNRIYISTDDRSPWK